MRQENLVPVTIPHIVVQGDADQVIEEVESNRAQEGRFWISRIRGSVSDEVEIAVSRQTETGELLFVPSETQAEVSRIAAKAIKLSVPSWDVIDLCCTFPVQLFRVESNVIHTVDVSNQGQLVALGDSNGGVQVFSVTEEDTARRALKGHYSDVTIVKFFPSSQVILSGSTDMRILLWSVVDGSNPREFVGHKSPITAIDMIGRGRNFVSGSADGELKLWECGSGRCLATLLPSAFRSRIVCLKAVRRDSDTSYQDKEFEFELGGMQVVAVYENGCIVIFDLEQKAEVSCTKLNEGLDEKARVNSADVSSGHAVLGYSNGRVSVFSLETNQQLWEFQLSSEITSLILSSAVDIFAATNSGQLNRIRFTSNENSSDYSTASAIISCLAGVESVPIFSMSLSHTTKKLFVVAKHRFFASYDITN